MNSPIVSPRKFLAVRHSVLNGNTYDVRELVDDTLSLERYTDGRAVIPCFEGDILQVGETGEIVLTHQNFFPLSEKKYKDLRENNLAASLKEVLDKIAAYKLKDGDQKVVLCFESKSITSKATVDETVRLLNMYGVEDAYFDSFLGDNLDAVQEANDNHGTNYAKSIHLLGNLNKTQLMVTQPKTGYDIITVPHTMSLGNVDEPVIYGAVGSIEILERIAEKPEVCGGYVRIKEGSGVEGALIKLWNSVTNTKKLRQTHISEYSNHRKFK